MTDSHTHCPNCGARFSVTDWPRTCGSCARTSYRNPAPVCVLLVPVRDQGGEGTSTGVLAVRRTIEPGRGRLALPGGFVNSGETWQAAGVRELREKTGITITADALQLESVHSASDDTLLLFARTPPLPSTAVGAVPANGETSELVVLCEPCELAFPLHTQALRTFFARRREPVVSRVLAAALTAVRAHDGQRRTGHDAPYVVHPLRVALSLSELRGVPHVDRDLLVLAALLHDVLEDSDVPRERLEREFGAEVTNVVAELTQDRNLAKAERRAQMLAHCGEMSEPARIVKLADRLDNMSEMRLMGEDFIARYCAEARIMLEHMRGSCPELEERVGAILARHPPA